MTMRPPRFGTSCHRMPLMLLLSAGLTIEKLAMYWTTVAPGVSGLALVTCGARPRSVMSVLFAAPWQPEMQSSPKARPLIVW
jgi:hypothetical protein